MRRLRGGADSIIERQVESAVQDMFDDKAVRVMKGISKVAAKQGGESTLRNYQLLGKRALIAVGVAVVAVQLTTSVVGFVMSRKNEEKRIEQSERVSFYAVAKRAGIARSTLYRCEDLRALVAEGRKGALDAQGSDDRGESSLEEGVETQLRHAILERDVLLQTLNAICEDGEPRPCRFAFVSLEDEAA